MAIQEKQITVDEFWETYADQPYELHQGRVVHMPPAGYIHGSIARRIAAIMGQFVDKNKLGDVVGAETGFYLSEVDMRGADAAFISNEKLAQITQPEKFLPFAPDLAVEVVSPGDRAGEIQSKVTLYLKGGTALVWVIYPVSKTVVVHFPDQTSKTLGDKDVLDGGDVLPGLSISIANLFPPASIEE